MDKKRRWCDFFAFMEGSEDFFTSAPRNEHISSVKRFSVTQQQDAGKKKMIRKGVPSNENIQRYDKPFEKLDFLPIESSLIPCMLLAIAHTYGTRIVVVTAYEGVKFVVDIHPEVRSHNGNVVDSLFFYARISSHIFISLFLSLFFFGYFSNSLTSTLVLSLSLSFPLLSSLLFCLSFSLSLLSLFLFSSFLSFFIPRSG